MWLFKILLSRQNYQWLSFCKLFFCYLQQFFFVLFSSCFNSESYPFNRVLIIFLSFFYLNLHSYIYTSKRKINLNYILKKVHFKVSSLFIGISQVLFIETLQKLFISVLRKMFIWVCQVRLFIFEVLSKLLDRKRT